MIGGLVTVGSPLNDQLSLDRGWGHAEEALSVLGTRGDVSVVFTDINLPGTIDGIALASESSFAGRRSRC